jgi:cephalosporin-C deacetylase-like acetyl esterase
MRTALAPALLLVSTFVVAQSAPAPKPAVDNSGRAQLNEYLDAIAARNTAARREQIAKITTREQAEVRQQVVRAKILELMGGTFEKTPLNARVLGATQLDGFKIEKIVYESQPKFYVPALLYIPDAKSAEEANAKLPAIVVAAGHYANGKVSDFIIASELARNGFAVLSYDPIGQGERLQYPDPAQPGKTLTTGATGEHAEAGLQPTLVGDALARYFAWDGIRAVDYLLSRPEIDPDRIGAYGCSGGGVMTALLTAADRRVKAAGVACYITSYDELLPSIGPQDAEQSTPNFIASGFDLADWVELAAPRPFAIIGTVQDMFPWKGLLASAREARRFYSLFDPSAEGKPTGRPEPPTPTGPTLNPDTSNEIPASAPLQVIAGIGRHANIRPLDSDILRFFLLHLAHSTAEPVVVQSGAGGIFNASREQVLAALGGKTAPDGSGSNYEQPNPAEYPTGMPREAFQVTPTGQVSTSFPDAATVYSLNLKRAAVKIPQHRAALTPQQLQTEIRRVTHAEAAPGATAPSISRAASSEAEHILHRMHITTDPGITIDAEFYRPTDGRKHPALLVLRPDVSDATATQRADEVARFRAMAKAGTAVMVVAPRPSPPGTEPTKSPMLGTFNMTEIRAELVGKTLLGMRIDDVIRAVDSLVTGETVDPAKITAEASGHLGLVLLHAAVLDPRLKHVTVDHTLKSYRALLEEPMPRDAPEDILPSVLLHYDVPDLIRALGARATVQP